MTRLDLVRWQFDLTWSLFEIHLDALTDDDFLWVPAAVCWTVRIGSDGLWRPDWDENELDPVPVPTIGWISWHIGWWWSVALDHLHQRTVRERTDILWPGSGGSAMVWLRGLKDEYRALLDRLSDDDLDAAATFPWPGESDKTVAHTLAWLNAELMKNVAEVGQLRLIRAARAGL
ncbi:DinB family protein [Antrihabitans sp. NCIMB 15449]|uniref:DinB family protein n=1 Tax=Antrihabitans spumae TaxID=3373370 RepID=A0ABW7JRT6_9NOCA